MISILIGRDQFSRQLFLDKQTKDQLVAKHGDDQPLPEATQLAGQSLFGETVVHIFEHCFSSLTEQYLETLRGLPVEVYLVEDSLDKRTTKVKELLQLAKKNSGVTMVEFPLPDRNSAPAWLVAHAKHLQINLPINSAKVLAKFLLGDTSLELSVLQAHQELLKLGSLANGQPITQVMITELVTPLEAIDIFKLLDAIANQRPAEVMELLNRYYVSTSDDEKSSTIRLVAILADQWRSMLLVKDYVERRFPEDQILATTGWKSGRLFIVKKNSARFSKHSLIQTLHKLSALDTELKSSTLPPRVIVDMIISSIMQV